MKQAPLARATHPTDLRRLLSGAPSSFGLLTACCLSRATAERDSEDVLASILDTPLSTLVTSLQTMCFQDSRLPRWFVRSCCKRLRKSMKRTVGSLVREGLIPPTAPAIQGRSVGRMTIREHARAQGQYMIDQWRQTLAEAIRLTRAKEGNADAFGELFINYEKAVFGFIMAHGANRTDAQEIAQETWKKIWQKIPTYDPCYGTFAAFARYWAGIMRRRCYEGISRRRRLEADLAHTPRTRLSVPDAMLLPLLYEELLRMTFGSASVPHQLIAFGFCKLLEWRPSDVVSRLSHIPLRELTFLLEDAYIRAAQPPADRVERLRSCFAPLHKAMYAPLAMLVSNGTAGKTDPALLPCVVGQTTLSLYYTDNADTKQSAADISQWWFAVERRLKGELSG
jgi:hypothetical protein